MITENVLLSQEIFHNIRHVNKGVNVIIKLDITKAYDRMSWNLLFATMRKFGFIEEWIDTIYRIVAGVWYSIIINDNREDFFTSTQGLKQGDPLSLFIIGAIVLSRSLNGLISMDDFTPFSMNHNGHVINHLA